MALDYRFNGGWLWLDADIEQGWRRSRKSFCFARKVICDWRDGARLSVTLEVFPLPRGFDQKCGRPPRKPCEGLHGLVKYHFDGRAMQVGLPLAETHGAPNPDLPWQLTPSGKPRIHQQWTPVEMCERGIQYEIQTLVVLEAAPIEPPVARQWGPDWSGGLPSLGKRG